MGWGAKPTMCCTRLQQQQACLSVRSLNVPATCTQYALYVRRTYSCTRTFVQACTSRTSSYKLVRVVRSHKLVRARAYASHWTTGPSVTVDHASPSRKGASAAPLAFTGLPPPTHWAYQASAAAPWISRACLPSRG